MKRIESTILVGIAIVVACITLLCIVTIIAQQKEEKRANEEVLLIGNFNQIEGSEYLVYNSDTAVVYYMFKVKETVGYQGYGYSYFAPYISENGKFCKYVDGHIVEINDDSKD